MTKNYIGGAVINSGPDLPLAADAPLGALFIKTGTSTGLYFYGFTPDQTPGIFGNQASQSWQLVVDLSGGTFVAKAGDSMTGQLVISTGSTPELRLTSVNPSIRLTETDQPLNAKEWRVWANGGILEVQTLSDAFTSPVTIFDITRGGAVRVQGNTVWHAGNDGAGSGLDADTLDGFQSTILPTASTVPVRDTLGNIAAASFEQTSANNENPVVSQVMVTSVDNLLRKSSIASFTTAVQGAATGTWSINATTANSANSAAVATNVAAGVAGNILYQSAPNVTAKLATGASNQVLVSGTTPSWTNSPTINGANFSGIPNASLTNSSITIGTTNIALGGTTTILSTLASLQVAYPGAVGGVNINRGNGSSNTGGVEFWGSNAIRAGYIGYANNVGSTDTGTLGYVASIHSFSGQVQASGNVIAYASDARLKKNIQVIPNAVEKVVSLGGYSYDWDMDRCRKAGFKPAAVHEHGLIAQEVEKVIPDAVVPAPFNSDYKTVMYDRVVSLLVAAIAEQQASIEDLKKQVAALKQR